MGRVLAPESSFFVPIAKEIPQVCRRRFKTGGSEGARKLLNQDTIETLRRRNLDWFAARGRALPMVTVSVPSLLSMAASTGMVNGVP